MEINVDLNTKPSRQFLIKLLQGILVYLLHERAQIPFSFDVFERFLSNKNFDAISCHKIQKQVNTARETYEKICSMQQIIKNEVSWTKSIIILFGSSIHTAKESFQLDFSSINLNGDGIRPAHHETSALRNALLQIITNSSMKFAKQLPITNTFILLNRYEPAANNPELHEIRDFKLNKTCKKFIFRINDDTPSFEIFHENIDEEETIALNDKSPQQEENDDENDYWYQSKVFIKGFNDVLVNNKSIWN